MDLTRKWIYSAIALSMIALAVGAVACSDDDDDGGDVVSTSTASGVEGASEQLCNDLDDLQTAIDGVEELSSASTLEEAQTAIAAVQTAWDDAKSSAEAFEQAKATALATAVENLGDTIQNISGSDSLGDAQADVSAAADEVAAARTDLSAAADCG